VNTPDAVVVLCTAPDEASAQDLAAKVLAEKLAACVTSSPATSLYYWEGKLEQEYEVQMLLKTNLAISRRSSTASNLIILTKPRNCWYYQCTAITIISHGSTHPYADPAAVQHVSFAGLFDAPGRSTLFLPIRRLFSISSKPARSQPHLAGERGLLPLSQAGSITPLRQTSAHTDARWRVA
jgi:periplasmic divalent cation tolerance protein